jgi:hypothetical protein
LATTTTTDSLHGSDQNGLDNRLTVSWYINEPKRGKRPNVRCDDNYDFYTLVKIKAGDELTVDYSKYSDPLPDWLMK